MDLLNKVEEKWKEVTLEEALLLLVCVVLVVIIVGYCVTLLLRKRNAKTQEGAPEVVVDVLSGRSGLGREETRGSLRWSERSKVCAAMVRQGEGSRSGSGRRTGSPMLAMWQRRILMGEKCQLPRFSGVILYDERGRPLQQQQQQHLHQHQQVSFYCLP